ncbi:MAG: Crp/Fnr family transcriptional regulator [Clostridiales Family XIII bacterium]|jgi:CRP-like cAMP-binding protein|nr:Crp/Fnr family transcriptional regulator [Clostridiales Family XIII bacterium]
MRDSKLFAGLTEAEYRALAAEIRVETRQLEPEQILVAEGERIDKLWFIETGKMMAARPYRDGQLDPVRVYTKKDVIGIDLAHTRTRTSPLQISSVTETALSGISYDFTDNPGITAVTREKLLMNIIRILADESIRKQTWLDALYQHSMRTRINIFLDYKRRKLGSNIFDLKMNRAELADHLGVNRSALSKELSRMQSEGLISYRKRHFEILDEESLRDRL